MYKPKAKKKKKKKFLIVLSAINIIQPSRTLQKDRSRHKKKVTILKK